MGGRPRPFFIWPALLLFLLSGPVAANPFSNLTLVYRATFDDGTLNPALDSLGIGPLQLGASAVPGANPTGVLEDGGLTLGITRPSGAVGLVGVGPVALAPFGQGSILGLRAVYAMPIGPHGPTDGWAAGTDIAAGDWVLVNGMPNRVESVSGTFVDGTSTMTLTLKYGLVNGAVDNDNVIGYKPVLANNAAGYAIGWNKAIEFDGTGSGYEPQVGQAIQIGSYVYTVIGKPTATSLSLDRSLEGAISDNDKIQPLPHGSYNFAFHRNAVTAAIRPLPPVPAGTGAKSSTVNYNGLTVRATMGYDMNSQNMIVTLDFLMGIQVLDTNLGAVLLA